MEDGALLAQFQIEGLFQFGACWPENASLLQSTVFISTQSNGFSSDLS